MVDKLRFHSNLNHVETHEHHREHYGVHIDERKMFRTIKEARSLVEGSIQLQYAKLWDYSHELTRSNEGSTVILALDNSIHGLYPVPLGAQVLLILLND